MGLLNTYPSSTCNTSLLKDLQNKIAKIAVVGLGEEGLTAALKLSKKYRVIGFDHNRDSVSLIQQEKMLSTTIRKEDYLGKDFFATSIVNLLEVATCYVLPVSKTAMGDSNFKRNVFTTAKFLKQDDVVILQSEVALSSTFSKEVIKNMERISGLVNGVDFNIVFVTLNHNKSVSLNLEGTDFCDMAFFHLVNTLYDAPHLLTVVKSPKKITTQSEVAILVKQIEKVLREQPQQSTTYSILLKGITSEKNTDNLNDSVAAALYKALYRKGYLVEVQDNHVLPSQVKEKYGIELKTSTTKLYDMIVIAVAHDNYENATKEQWAKNCHKHTVVIDKNTLVETACLN